MVTALQSAYEAIPEPKLVIALGDCAADGGIFGCNYATMGKVATVIPVNMVITGCPSTPSMILSSLVTLITSTQSNDAFNRCV